MTSTNWFNANDIKIPKLVKKNIINKNIKGYVLPHAGTKFTGHILSHTLRFAPTNFFDNIVILYYPANNTENVEFGDEKYYHEYYVLKETLDHVTEHIWKYGKKDIIGINVRDSNNYRTLNNLNNTLLIISADFSHFLELHKAIYKENCAAHTLIHRHIYSNLECLQVIDHVDSFKSMYEIIPQHWYLQWIGRTRSPDEEGVGYLSFFIKQPQHVLKRPNGMFVTAYDIEMKQRECLGEWFNKRKKYNKQIEDDLIERVIDAAITTSRLTGGKNKHVPVKHYTVTYLYKDIIPKKTPKTSKTSKTSKTYKHKKSHNTPKFIRRFHGIKGDAFYLPDVMLENAFNNGEWIEPHHTRWPKNNNFNLKDTLRKIGLKAGKLNFTRKKKMNNTNNNKNKQKDNFKLYYSDVKHDLVQF